MAVITPPLVRRLRAIAPHATIEIEHVGAASTARLDAGDLDLAFWGATPPDPPFMATQLFRERFVGVVDPRHPLAVRAGQGLLTLDDYLAYPHVQVTFSDPRLSPVDAALAAVGRRREVAVVTPSFASNLAALRGADLVMALPSRLVKAAGAADLVAFALPLAVPDYPYSMVWHRRTDDDPPQRWLRGLVEDVCAPLAAGVPPAADRRAGSATAFREG